MDGDTEFFGGKGEVFGDQFPGKSNGVVFEIIAEGKIAEHFEKSMVARGIANIIEVVVLSAGADAFLAGRRAGVGALVLAGEHVLKLDHPGIHEHQCGVVLRDQRRGFDDRVALPFEET